MGTTLGANGGKCNLAGVYIKKYGTPAVSRGEQNVHSYQMITYVLTAPQFSRSAGCNGEHMGVGLSRTLEMEN